MSRSDGAVTDYNSTTTGTFTNNSGSPEVHIINVSTSATILDLNVGMNLEHTWRGDVRVTLESPNGTRVEIIATPTADSDDHFDVLLDDASGNSLDDGTNNTTAAPNFELDRTAAPSNALSAFNGENQQGDWRFEFVDLDIGATSDRIGTFNLAKLQIETGNVTVQVKLFDDKFWNGVYDPSIDTTAVTGVTMTITDQTGNSQSATDNGDGTYTLDGSALSGDEYLLKVDEGTLPAGYFPGVISGGSTALTQVLDVSSGSASVEIPVQMPKTECLVPDDFDMFTTCFVGGPRDDHSPVQFLDENSVTQTMIPATSGAIVAFPRPAASSTPSTQNRYLATIEEVGSTYGLSVQDTLNRIYAGTFTKRHSDYGPGGSGAIYVVDTSGGGVLDTFTISGAGTTTHGIDATNAANNGTEEGWLRDSNFFGVVGKEGLGDVEMNTAQTVIWTINLNNKHLYMVDVADPTLAAYGTVTDLGEIADPGCPGGPDDWRPFALEYHDGELYIGGTCTGQTNQSIAEMDLQVFRVTNPTTVASTVTMTQVFTTRVSPTDGGLAYVRGDSTIEWSPWIDAWNVGAFGVPSFATFAHVYPQPLLTDIEFDNNNNLILGLRDRFGDQIGINTKSPGTGSSGDLASDNGLYETVSMGEILQACWDPLVGSNVTNAVEGDWTLEGQTGPSGICGPQSDDPNDSVTSLEFYGVTSYGGIHPETAQGGLAFHTNFSDQIATTGQDPFSLRSGGVSFYSTLDGTSTYQNGDAAGGHQVYGGQNTSSPGQSLLGKANGLGDLEYSCGVTGQQIGNRVWLDEDGDGLQDPVEVPIAGVTVYLYVDLDGDGTYDDLGSDGIPDPVRVTTTDADGLWYFSTRPLTSYAVAFDPSTASAFNDSAGTPVVVADLAPTLADALGGTLDTEDSDVLIAIESRPALELVTGATGVSAHHYAAGFTGEDLVAIGNLIFRDVLGDGDFDSGSDSGVSGVTVELFNNGDNPATATPVLTTVTDVNGCYIFDNLAPGIYFVHVPNEEFLSGGDLPAHTSSNGNGSDETTDQDADENGIDVGSPSVSGVSSTNFNLQVGLEPINETTASKACYTGVLPDADVNLTADLGFVCPVITVSPSSLPDGVVGTAYSEQFTAAGGTSPYTYAVTGTLPDGLSFSVDTISGTPTSETSRTFTVTATDAHGCVGTRQYTVQPVCPTITLSSTPSTLPSATIGTPYSARSRRRVELPSIHMRSSREARCPLG